MREAMLRVAEGALRAFIEEAIQSDEGLTDEDIRYIEKERKYIRLVKVATA